MHALLLSLQLSTTIIRVRLTTDCALTVAQLSTLVATSVIAVTVTEFHPMTTNLASV